MMFPVPGPRPRRPRPDPGDKADPEQNLLFLYGFSMGSMGSAADPGAGRWGAPAGRGLLPISFPSFSISFTRFPGMLCPVPGPRRAAARAARAENQ